MSDASTSLADHPAGKTKTPSRRGITPSSTGRRGRWQTKLWDSTPTSVLLAEAEQLIEARNWRRAIRILAVAAATTTGDDHRLALQRLAVTSADGGQHRVSCEAVFELQQSDEPDADTWVTFANVALARGNYAHADAAARSAFEQDPDHRQAWLALASAYAGRGWFDEADACLGRVDRTTLTEMERWRIGRAINRWSLAKSRWLMIAAVSAVLVGVLAVAVAVSVPFAMREWRLRQLRSTDETKHLEVLAGQAWRFEKRLRLAHALTVVASVAGFIGAIVFL